MQTADGFHHGVDAVIFQNIPEIVGHLGIGKGDILPAQHLYDLHIVPGPDDFIYAPANNAETQKTDVHRLFPPV